MSEGERGVVGRRLAIGLALTVVTAAFAIIPTESLDGAASRPLYVYLVPVLRSVVRLQSPTAPAIGCPMSCQGAPPRIHGGPCVHGTREPRGGSVRSGLRSLRRSV